MGNSLQLNFKLSFCTLKLFLIGWVESKDGNCQNYLNHVFLS